MAASFKSDGNFRMLAQAIERVAEEKKLSQFGIVEGLDAEMVARAKKQLSLRVPDGKGKIAAQVLHAIGAPRRVGTQNQIGISGVGHVRTCRALELDQLAFAVPRGNQFWRPR